MTVLAAPSAFANLGALDPEFDRFPVTQWLNEKQSQIHWSVLTPPANLSTHQRLILRITARVDGREIEKRRAAGEFLGFIEYRDAEGHVWQNHISVNPARLQAAMQRQILDITFYAFMLPGDYTISLAICDPATRDHSAAVRRIRVNPLKPDPLPHLWDGLPPVEIVSGNTEPPDVWFLPEVETTLHLPVATKHPVHIQLLVNTTPSAVRSSSLSELRDNMSVAIPALKIFSRMDLKEGSIDKAGSIDAALLDLTRRTVPLEQQNLTAAGPLNWTLFRGFFADAKPGIIDIRTLGAQRRILGFFRDELLRRSAPRPDGARQVLIVLSGPAFFDDQDLPEPSTEPFDPLRQLIYIRYRTPQVPRRRPPGMPPMIGRGAHAPNFPLPEDGALIPPLREDDLEKVARSLNARVFDAASALQFRRILAAVVDQISGL